MPRLLLEAPGEGWRRIAAGSLAAARGKRPDASREGREGSEPDATAERSRGVAKSRAQARPQDHGSSRWYYWHAQNGQESEIPQKASGRTRGRRAWHITNVICTYAIPAEPPTTPCRFWPSSARVGGAAGRQGRQGRQGRRQGYYSAVTLPSRRNHGRPN